MAAPYVALAQMIVNPISRPIKNSDKQVHVREFAQIPVGTNRKASRIVGIARLGKNLYVTTSVSDGIIHRVKPDGTVTPWFRMNDAMKANTGRPMSTANAASGGIRGLAFHTKFRTNGLFYVSLLEDRMGEPPRNFNYLSFPTEAVDADSVVLEFKANTTTFKPIARSQREILRIGMPAFMHAIRQIAFRGKFLYITQGDASSNPTGDRVGGGQNNNGLGKVLRINPKRDGAKPYTIPRTNPFVGKAEYLDEIYAVGFRNPHNLCFSKRGELFLADIGRDNIEEVNIVKSGLNYGWELREGPFVQVSDGGVVTGVAPLPDDEIPGMFEYPVAAWGHFGPPGDKNFGQAIAMGCPIENKSPLKHHLLYANFGASGEIYFSLLGEMRKAVTNKPKRLKMARTFRPKIFFDHDNDPSTPPRRVENLLEIVRMDPGLATLEKVNCRFGQGKGGEIYFSSKGNGKIYLITSTVPGARV